MITTKHIFWLKAFIHITNICSFIYLCVLVFTDRLGGDPVQGITHFTGIAALNALLLTLLVTPIATYFKQGNIFRVRRVIGLYSFFWASLHMLTYFGLNLALDFTLFSKELTERPYLTLGAICWLILLALTITSTKGMQSFMGGYWQKLHNLVYLVLFFAPIHYYWSVKSGVIKPSIYIFVAVLLLLLRRKKFIRWFKS